MPQNRTNIPDPSEELMSLFRTFIPTFGTMITTALLFTLDHVFWEILELLVKYWDRTSLGQSSYLKPDQPGPLIRR